MSEKDPPLTATGTLYFVVPDNLPNAKAPQKSSPEDSGYDVYANQAFELKPHSMVFVDTKVAVVLPRGFELQVRSRSGLAAKKGVFVLNSPGTIDQHYTGTVGVVLFNTSANHLTFSADDRIAQLVLAPVCEPAGVEVVVAQGQSPALMAAAISETVKGQASSRGAKGFGSSG